MNEHLYRHLVLLLLSYAVTFGLVLTITLVGVAAALGAVVLGTIVALGVLAVAG